MKYIHINNIILNYTEKGASELTLQFVAHCYTGPTLGMKNLKNSNNLHDRAASVDSATIQYTRDKSARKTQINSVIITASNCTLGSVPKTRRRRNRRDNNSTFA